jgi:hypothetical protein
MAEDTGLAPGDLVVRRGGSGETLVRVASVGLAGRASIRLPRIEAVFSGIYVHDGRLRAVDDLPIGSYRRASDAEIAAARERELLPPDVTDEAPFA